MVNTVLLTLVLVLLGVGGFLLGYFISERKSQQRFNDFRKKLDYTEFSIGSRLNQINNELMSLKNSLEASTSEDNKNIFEEELISSDIDLVQLDGAIVSTDTLAINQDSCDSSAIEFKKDAGKFADLVDRLVGEE